MSVGHSRRTRRRPSPQAPGLSARGLLQLALDPGLLKRRGLAHVVLDVGDHLGHADLQPPRSPSPLAHHDQARLLLDHGRRSHPVLRLVPAGVGVDHHRAVRLDHHEPQRLRQDGGQATGVDDLAAGDDQAHPAEAIPTTGRPLRRRRPLVWRAPPPLRLRSAAQGCEGRFARASSGACGPSSERSALELCSWVEATPFATRRQRAAPRSTTRADLVARTSPFRHEQVGMLPH